MFSKVVLGLYRAGIQMLGFISDDAMGLAVSYQGFALQKDGPGYYFRHIAVYMYLHVEQIETSNLKLWLLGFYRLNLPLHEGVQIKVLLHSSLH